MTTKHTPGPLVVVDDPASRDWYVIKDPGTRPFKARNGGLVAWVFTSEADALLFAAAPEAAAERDRLKEVNAELLEALKTFPGFTDDATVGDDWLEKALAATAKAEGRE